MDKLSETEPPWGHQLEAVRLARDQHDFALFFKPGAGKTRAAIRIAINKMHEAGRNLRTLIFTPPVVVPQFRNEWFKYTNIAKEKVVVLARSQKKRMADFMYERDHGANIFITNYEALQMEELFDLFFAWRPEIIIWDESHNLKSPKTKTKLKRPTRSGAADMLANPYDGKIPLPRPINILMSGTPILTAPQDIFQQFKVMDGGESFGTNFFVFRGKYFRDKNEGMDSLKYFPKWEPMTLKKHGFDSIGEIQKIIQKKALYADVDRFLPPETYIQIKTPMTGEQAIAYKAMKDDLVAEVKTGVASVNLAITKALRLMQIASGFLSIDDDPEKEQVSVKHEFEDAPKQEALRELLEQITGSGAKVLIWAVWRQNYLQIKKICEDLKLEYVEVHGGINAKTKDENINRFNSDPKCCVYIGHPRSGGVGLNLIAATYSIFYSRTFSLEHYEQAKRRNFRGGQTHPVTHYSLVCEGTIDEAAVEALVNKQQMSDRLIRDILLGP